MIFSENGDNPSWAAVSPDRKTFTINTSNYNLVGYLGMRFNAYEPTYAVTNGEVKFGILFDCVVKSIGLSSSSFENKLTYDIQPFLQTRSY